MMNSRDESNAEVEKMRNAEYRMRNEEAIDFVEETVLEKKLGRQIAGLRVFSLFRIRYSAFRISL
jgi:hypothetical protein